MRGRSLRQHKDRDVFPRQGSRHESRCLDPAPFRQPSGFRRPPGTAGAAEAHFRARLPRPRGHGNPPPRAGARGPGPALRAAGRCGGQHPADPASRQSLRHARAHRMGAGTGDRRAAASRHVPRRPSRPAPAALAARCLGEAAAPEGRVLDEPARGAAPALPGDRPARRGYRPRPAPHPDLLAGRARPARHLAARHHRLAGRSFGYQCRHLPHAEARPEPADHAPASLPAGGRRRQAASPSPSPCRRARKSCWRAWSR